MRRLLLVLLLLAALLAQCLAGAAYAQEIDETFPNWTTYDGVGGVVERVRGMAKTRALLQELDVAYVDLDVPLLTIGKNATWTVHATGGDGMYEYSFQLYHREGTEGLLWGSGAQGRSSENSFTRNIMEAGQYMLVVKIFDRSGSYIEYKSQVFECAGKADYNNENTVAGKVEALARQCMEEAGSSDYARALWLHDWLIYNANYDYTFSNYYADGVLLKGTGVCQSYALAYEMLLTRVGIESIYITGEVDSGGHAWNLVKLDGEWYHVDCTWDDPGRGGSERHSYFCLTDEKMALDHDWNVRWEYMPSCDSTKYSYMLRSGIGVRTPEEFKNLVREVLAAGGTTIGYVNLSTDESFDPYQMMDSILRELGVSYRGMAYRMSGEYGFIAIDTGSGYPDKPLPSKMCMDEESLILSVGESYRPLLHFSPSQVMVNKGSYQVWEKLDAGSLDIEWTSSDPDVVTVENGRIKAIGKGMASVTASCGAVRVQCQVLVQGGVSGSADIMIPRAVQMIADEAFLNCTDIASVAIADGSSLSIGSRAFAGCTGLETIYIPSGVTRIAGDAFAGAGSVVILCPEGSAAHSFAQNYGIAFMLVESYS